MILLIDNYDSFVHNLARYFQRLGQVTEVVRNDAMTVAQVAARRPRAVIISPGPCGPAESGVSLDVVRQLYREVPILGVCLGHQVIGAAFGARVVRADQPTHGRAGLVFHDHSVLFHGLPQPMTAGRYHSLVVAPAPWPDELRVTARTADGTIMALEHRVWPVFGVQFHPESILTEGGYQLLSNFLARAGLPAGDPLGAQETEVAPPVAVDEALPCPPITF